MGSTNYEANGYEHKICINFANHFALRACFVSYKERVRREKVSELIMHIDPNSTWVSKLLQNPACRSVASPAVTVAPYFWKNHLH